MRNRDEDRVAKLKETVRLLKLALDQCRAMLVNAQQDIEETEQDNEPPSLKFEI